MKACVDIKTQFNIDAEESVVTDLDMHSEIFMSACTSYIECLALRALDTVKERTQLRKMVIALEVQAKTFGLPWSKLYGPLVLLLEQGKTGNLPGLK